VAELWSLSRHLLYCALLTHQSPADRRSPAIGFVRVRQVTTVLAF
jgi:hypothetical protein